MSVPSSNPELEAALRSRVDDPEAWAVYGDWLLSQGDPRGELVHLELEREARGEDGVLEARIAELVAAHRDEWLGADLVARLRNDLDAWGEAGLFFEWRYGFLWRAHIKRIQHSGDLDVARVVREVLDRPTAGFLEELALGLSRDVRDLQPAIRVLAALESRPTVRRLFLGDFDIMNDASLSQVHVGDVSSIGRVLPRLRALEIQGREVGLDELDLPELETLKVRTHALPAAAARAVTKTVHPALKTLELWLGDRESGGDTTLEDLRPLLEGEPVPRLERLGLMNSELADDLVAALASSSLLPRLRELDLSLGALTDLGAEAMLERAGSFTHLSVLNLDENLLSDGIKSQLRRRFGSIVSTTAQRPDFGDRLVAFEE